MFLVSFYLIRNKMRVFVVLELHFHFVFAIEYSLFFRHEFVSDFCVERRYVFYERCKCVSHIVKTRGEEQSKIRFVAHEIILGFCF